MKGSTAKSNEKEMNIKKTERKKEMDKGNLK